MSSSGLIYAVIVGAWAVYLVPMWLRREDELNHARQTQRYAAAIKVLSNKEAFERRWAKPGEEAVELPIAVGQTTAAPVARTKPTPKTRTQAASTAAATTTATTARVATPTPSRPKPALRPTAATTLSGRGGLMARRRRVVALLFGMSTLGALISADLGAAYLWVMAVPAVLLSVYIVRLRKEERSKAADRARRQSAAAEARTAREAEARSRQAKQQRAEADAKAKAEAQAREAELGSSDRRQQQAAARRRTAAARARAQSYTPQSQDTAPLRRASNG
jgi:hypothetical protein